MIAPDLVGHGDSATPRGDYSLGAHAAVIRDLLSALGIGSATVVGHSFGGGVAMVFFWQFPHRVERLALVSSGGLGEEVSPLLRSVALPGASALISLAGADRVTGGARPRGRRAARARLGPRRAAAGDRPRAAPARRPGRARGVRAHPARGDRRARPARQRGRPAVSARGRPDADRLGRARPHDPDRARPRGARGGAAQPLRRARGRRPLPAPRSAGGLATALLDWIAATEPAALDDEAWRSLLRRRASARPRAA